MIANRKYPVLWPIFQDCGLLNLSLLLTYLLLARWLGPASFPLGAYLLTSMVGSITVCLLGLALSDQHQHSAERNFPPEPWPAVTPDTLRPGIAGLMDDVARALLVGGTVLVLSLYLIFGLHLEPGVVGLILSVSVLSLLARRVIPGPAESVPRNLVIVGSPTEARAIAELLEQNPCCGFRLVGMIEERPNAAATQPLAIPILGGIHGLTRTLDRLQISTVIVGSSRGRSVLPDPVLSEALVLGAPEFFEAVAGKLPVRLIPAHHFEDVLAYRSNPWFDTVRRLFDIVVSLLALPFVALISVIIVPLIKWESPGPALYSQERVGLNGQVFQIFKFRSMVPDAESNGAVYAQENDPRVTRIGKFIRLTRIDELPQFLNVLRGEMSLIGPRPERPEFVAELEKTLPYFSYRHLVKPGITGWAQVQYGYGSSLYDSLEKLQYDLYYIKHRTSPLLDLQILFSTIGVIVSRRGAR